MTRSGTKWNSVSNREIVGPIQNGKAELVYGELLKAFSKAISPERRCMVTWFVCEQEDAVRRTKAMGQSKPQSGYNGKISKRGNTHGH